MSSDWWTEPSYAVYFGRDAGRWVQVDPDPPVYSTQRYYPVEIDEPSLPYVVRAVVEATPRGPRCVDLRCVARTGGQPVTSAGLRHVPVGQVVRLAEDEMGVADLSGDERAARSAYRRAVTRSRNAQRRWLLDEDKLAKVAQIYRQALAMGAPPTGAVRDYFKITRGQAARWVVRARQEGHLGPAPGRRLKGEEQ